MSRVQGPLSRAGARQRKATSEGPASTRGNKTRWTVVAVIDSDYSVVRFLFCGASKDEKDYESDDDSSRAKHGTEYWCSDPLENVTTLRKHPWGPMLQLG